MAELNFLESAKLRGAILHDLTKLAIDREIEAVTPEAATRAAQLLILRYLTEVIVAPDIPDIAEQFAAAVGLAAESDNAIDNRY